MNKANNLIKKRLISRAVLKTELSFAMKLIQDHNFGYARELIAKMLERVKEYDLDKKRENV